MTPLAHSLTAPGLRAALSAAERRLAVADVPSPRHDAEELAAHALGIERRELLQTARTARTASWRPATAAAFAASVERRAAREPLQHITGRAYFRHLVLAVGPGVFVPRPETEVVADVAILEAKRVAHLPAVVVDLATGSGAIALAVATEVPGARVHAVELDEKAQAAARLLVPGGLVVVEHADLQGESAPAVFAATDHWVDVADHLDLVGRPRYLTARRLPAPLPS